MEWILRTSDHAAASELRREVRAHLARHARPGEDLDGAEMAFSELLTNAVEHAGTRIWVELDWSSASPVVIINDVGKVIDLAPLDEAADIDPTQPHGRGLIIATALSREVRSSPKSAGGTSVRAVLDVVRDTTVSHDVPPRPLTKAMPRLSEADDDGFFGTESFLRALVVEMATAVQDGAGPDTAEKAVAAVGATVGNKMETAFRNARGLTERLDHDQLGELYVGLKSAIGGEFEVVEVHHDRIVLRNDECPFGDVVREAPGLCRMTSSVFGGIAARNTDGDVAVMLEERIAVGDPQCKVTVWLDEPPTEIASFVHRYRNATQGGVRDVPVSLTVGR